MDVSALLQEIEAKRQNAWRGYLFCGLMGIAPVAMFLLRKTTAAFLILALWALYYFFLVRPDAKKFNEAFLRGNLLTALSAQLDRVEYHGRPGIPQKELLGDRLLPVREGNSCLTFHRVTGSAKGMKLELSDATFQLDGSDGKGRPVFFSGCWVRIELDHFTWRNLRLVTRDFIPPAQLSPWFRETADLIPMEPENPRVRSAFALWGQEGAPGLSDSALGHLADLREKDGAPLAMSLEGDRLTFFLPRRFISPGDPSVRSPIPEAALRRSPLPELDGILGIAAACRRLEVPEENS